MNKPPKGEELKRLNAHLALLKVSAQDIPNMTVKVSPGNFWMNGNSIVEFAGGTSAIITKPTQGSKYVCIVINKYAQLVVVDGVVSTTLTEPALPIVTKDMLPLAIMYIRSSTTVITNDMIYDVRPLFNWGTFKLTHAELDLKDIADSHSISAITGLREELDEKSTYNDVNNLMVTKADFDGTTSNIFILNKDVDGESDEDTILEFHRGAEGNAAIKFNEVTQRLEYTNDGINYYPLSTIEGLYTQTEIDNALISKANIVDVYNKIEIDEFLTNKADTTTVYVKTEIDDLLSLKADQLTTYTKTEVDTLVDTKVAGVVDTAPDMLNTLNELAQALNDDANFATTITNELNLKANVADVYNKTNIDTALAAKANTTDIYTQTEMNSSLDLKADKSTTYTKTEVEDLLSYKANTSDVYVKTEIDNSLNLKADKLTTYMKTEVDTALSYKANSSDVYVKTEVYTKIETDALLNGKVNATDVYTKTEVDGSLDLKADQLTTYTKTEVDTALSYKASTLDISQYVDARINGIIDAAPASLDTLNEIATALNNDANLATTLTNEIAKKANALDVYTKTEIDTELALKADTTTVNTSLADKANIADVYNKTNMDAALLLKADATYVDTELELKANALDVYTKTEIDTSLLTPKTIYVDKNRIDIYTSNGSMTKPFKTVQEALAYISTLVGERIVIDIAPGVYEETFDLTINNSSIRINLNEALLKGNFTLTDATTIANSAGLKIIGMGVRSSYDSPNFLNNCIQGDFIYHALAKDGNKQTRLDFVNSGIIGNISAIGTGDNRLWSFWTNSRWSGLMSTGTGTADCGIIVCAYNVNSSTSNSIGAASGRVVAYKLYNCIIKGAWNVSIAQGNIIWRNVIWDVTNNFTGCTGTINTDSNSAASFLNTASNPGGLTFNFADKANTIGYTPTNLTDWADPKPKTITEAIDRIAAIGKTLNGGNYI